MKSFLKILQHYTCSFHDKDIFLYKLHSIYRMDIGSDAHHNLRISTFISNFAVTIDKHLWFVCRHLPLYSWWTISEIQHVMDKLHILINNITHFASTVPFPYVFLYIIISVKDYLIISSFIYSRRTQNLII